MHSPKPVAASPEQAAAPTAEEQLPPKDECETEWEYAARLYSTRVVAKQALGMVQDQAEYTIAVCLQLELLAALRSNREKDAQLAELKEKFGIEECEGCGELSTELREDAGMNLLCPACIALED